MARSPSTENYMIGKGNLYFARFSDADVNLGERHLGNAPNFSLNITKEQLEHYSSMQGIRYKDASVNTLVSPMCKFTLDEPSLDNIALSFLGNDVHDTLSQTDGHQVNDSIVAKVGRYKKLAFRNIIPGSTHVTNAAGTIAYTSGVDYTIDHLTGRIYIVQGGFIADNQNILVDYDYADIAYDVVNAAVNAQVEGFLRYIGNNDVGNNYEVEIWKCKLTMTGDMNFISTEWNTLEMEGEILQDATKITCPYFRVIELSNPTMTQS